MASRRSDQPVSFVRSLPESVSIREVGPRDGLQPEAPVSVEQRVHLIESLQAAGLQRIEVAAFVSPEAVPAMAGATQVVAGIARPDGFCCVALVPNLRGAQMAIDAGVDEITVTISASMAYNERNVRMSIDESVAVIGDIVSAAGAARHEQGIGVDAVISCAFGSPYEGEIAPFDVAALAHRLLSTGVTSVTYADTTGMATPRRIDEVLDAGATTSASLAAGRVGLHLHDTRGVALANTYAALERGVTRFDTSVGGLGGSPFAHGAGGNLATESLVHLLDDLSIETGVDLEALLESAALIGEIVGRDLPSPIVRHGPRTRLATPT